MPKLVDHEARRSEIAQAFFRVILEHGIAGATTREIARAANVSLGVLAHYFGDKEGLVLAAFGVLIGQFERRLVESAAGLKTPGAVLEAICVEALPLDEPRRLESSVWLSFWAHGYADAALRERQRSEYARWLGTLATILSFRPGPPDMQRNADDAVALAAMNDGLTVQMMLRGPADLPPERAAELMRQAVRRIT